MLLSVSVTLICVCIGVSAAALGGYPLYLGFLAGWLCLPLMVAIVLLPCIVMDKIRTAYRTSNPQPLTDNRWKYRNKSSYAC